MALIKRLVQTSLRVDFAESLRLAGPAQAIARRTEDHREGGRAFIEKRRPAFKGRGRAAPRRALAHVRTARAV